MENYYFDIIKNIIDQNKLSQVYLLSSSPNLDLNKYIVYFINKINNENFDSLKSIKFGELYFLVEGNKKNSIKKDELAEACKDVIESSLTSNKKYKILILKNIENSSISSLNAMLKFLEEPPKNTIILMTTNNKNKVLKTIKSRAFEIKITNKSITKIDNKYLEFFCQISDNEEFLKQINQDENVKLFKEKYFKSKWWFYRSFIVFIWIIKWWKLFIFNKILSSHLQRTLFVKCEYWV